MAKIKSIVPTMYNNQPDGGFDVVLTDGLTEVTGSIGKKDKKSDTGLKVGDEVTYSVNPWTSPKGTVVNFLTVNRAISPAPAPARSGAPSASSLQLIDVDMQKKLQKCEDARFVMGQCFEALRTETFKWEEFENKFKEAVSVLYDEVDAIFDGKE